MIHSAANRNFIASLWLAVTALSVLALPLGWAWDTPGEILLNYLGYWTVWSLGAALVVLLCGLVWSRRYLRSAFAAVALHGRIMLSGIVITTLLLAGFLVPRVNRLYYDEFLYQQVGQSIAFTGRAFLAVSADAGDGSYTAWETEYNKEPNAYPFFLALGYKIFGMHEWVAFLLNQGWLALGICGVFGMAYLLFQSRSAALFSAACYALTPVVMIWSQTAASETSAAAMAACAMCAAVLYARYPGKSTLLLLAGALALAAQFRPESVMILIPAFLTAACLAPAELKKPWLYGMGLVLTLLLLAHILHLFAVRAEDWGCKTTKFSWDYFVPNLKVNAWYYLANDRYPVVFSGLALTGFFTGGRWREKITLFFWFLLFWGVFLFFYAGSYDHGVDVRYAVLSAAPAAIFSGAGAAGLTGWITRCASGVAMRKRRSVAGYAAASGKLFRPVYAVAAAVVLAVFLIAAWLKFVPLFRILESKSQRSREDVECIRDFSQIVPENSMVLSDTPSVWLVLGQNSAQLINAVYNREWLEKDLFARYAGGVYVHWGFWCNTPELNYAATLIKVYHGELIRGKSTGKKRYALYRLYENPS